LCDSIPVASQGEPGREPGAGAPPRIGPPCQPTPATLFPERKECDWGISFWADFRYFILRHFLHALGKKPDAANRPICDSITVASKDSQDGSTGQEPDHGPVFPKPTKPGGIIPRTQGVRSGNFFLDRFQTFHPQAFPTRFREKARCGQPPNLPFYSRRQQGLPEDGSTGQEPDHGSVFPKPTKPGGIIPERRDCDRGFLFLSIPTRPKRLRICPTIPEEKARWQQPSRLPSLSCSRSKGLPGGDNGSGAPHQGVEHAKPARSAALSPNTGIVFGDTCSGTLHYCGLLITLQMPAAQLPLPCLGINRCKSTCSFLLN